MRLFLVVTLFAIAIVFAFYLVVMNRASEKIVTAVIPIAVLALVSIFLSVLVFGGIKPMSERFPVSFLYDIEDKSFWAGRDWLGWRYRYDPFQRAWMELYQKQPEIFVRDTSQVEHLRHQKDYAFFHHLLQWAILDWMRTRFSSSWEIELIHLDLPQGRQEGVGGTGQQQESTVISQEEISQLLQGNYFANIHTLFGRQLALPPGSRMQIRVPVEPSGIGEIAIKNEFCTISIETRDSSWSMGIGAYNRLGNLPSAKHETLATSSYEVIIRADFNRLRSGHPKMEKYSTWAKQIVEGLKRQFDERVIWEKTKEEYILSKIDQIQGSR